ncbi:quinol oxidase, partial [Streptococcus pyogenes]
AIQQTFFYNIHLEFAHGTILWTVAIVVAALLASGFLKNFFMTLFSFKDGQHSYIKSTLILAFLAELVFIIGNPNFDAS